MYLFFNMKTQNPLYVNAKMFIYILYVQLYLCNVLYIRTTNFFKIFTY